MDNRNLSNDTKTYNLFQKYRKYKKLISSERVSKYTIFGQWNSTITPFFLSKDLSIVYENVVFVLGLTGVGDSVVLNAQILDKGADNKILFEWTGIDTPEVDPPPDNNPPWAAPDPGLPFKNGARAFLSFIPSSTSPTSEWLMDNLEYDYIPQLDIAKAVLLTFPVPPDPFTYKLYGAPSVDGPWVEVPEPMYEIDGMYQCTVPTSLSEMKVFQLMSDE